MTGRMIIGQQHWWQDSGEIARLLRYLNDGLDGPLEMADAIYIVEKPWKWDEEYAEMCKEQTEPGGIGEDDVEEMVR